MVSIPEELSSTARGGRVTLRTIAEMAGVHVSTVSRILNNQLGDSQHTAAPETVDRVLAVAAGLRYTPNPSAKSLRTRRSSHIGVLVPTLTDIVLATIYEGIEEAAERHGYSTYVTNSLDDPARRERQTATMLARHPDAMIFGDADFHSDFLERQRRKGVQFCLVSRRAEGFLSATTDDYRGGQLAAEHLLQLGLFRAAVLAGRSFASTAIDRTAGFVDTFRDAGHPIPKHLILYGPFHTVGGHEAMQSILSAGVSLDAVFATNDFAAIGAMGALRDAGLVAGADVAVIGYNDVPLSAAIPIPLTTIRSDHNLMGQKAVELIVKLLNDEQPASILLPPTLVARESTLGAASARTAELRRI